VRHERNANLKQPS